ncbi:MAG: hypothetical protein K2N71_02150 [Oscillospiraceae bacterium]|nr:hypothetical protein [Oscillospiraceae bacterium]
MRKLKTKQKITVSFNISDVYDISKLESVRYSIYIDSAGYADFLLHDN